MLRKELISTIPRKSVNGVSGSGTAALLITYPTPLLERARKTSHTVPAGTEVRMRHPTAPWREASV